MLAHLVFVPLDVIAAGVNDIPPEMFMLWIGGMIFVFVIAPAIAAAMKSDPGNSEPGNSKPRRRKFRDLTVHEQVEWWMTHPRPHQASPRVGRGDVLLSRFLRFLPRVQLTHSIRFSSEIYPEMHGFWVSKREVLNEYKLWCSNYGFRPHPECQILRRLAKLGWVPGWSNGIEGFRDRPSRRARRARGLPS